MGKIKSAWEIALERTENIVVDSDRIRHNQTIDKIRRVAGAFLVADTNTIDKTREELSGFSKEDLKEALTLTVLNGLTLPSDEITDDRYERLASIFEIINSNQDASTLFSQITNLLKQYPMHKKQLLEQMKAQFEPMLREKEAQMREQYGQEVQLSLENDKEFAQAIRQNIEKLDNQYQQTLDNAKEQLKALLS